MTKKSGRYEAVVGLDYTPDGGKEPVRREPGDRFDDPRQESLKWLLADGLVIDHEATEAADVPTAPETRK